MYAMTIYNNTNVLNAMNFASKLLKEYLLGEVCFIITTIQNFMIKAQLTYTLYSI